MIASEIFRLKLSDHVYVYMNSVCICSFILYLIVKKEIFIWIKLIKVFVINFVVERVIDSK